MGMLSHYHGFNLPHIVNYHGPKGRSLHKSIKLKYRVCRKFHDGYKEQIF